eukprot:TRINITY_DN5998_c0_g1_i1.p1 TRINITY_DN5998_c0_g1~~TRINITY_DN5998_c0_g1_i1.p1  ORF type:complete len:224 (-),score=44.39 TRINITY_DN5998_c0_g1_i1:18-689(-)
MLSKTDARYRSPSGQELLFRVHDFVQSNFEMNRKLLTLVKDKLTKIYADLNVTQNKNMLELFAGNGNFTVFLAEMFERVTAIENDRSSVDSLEKNLQENNVDNVVVLKMDVNHFFDQGPKRRERWNKFGRPIVDKLPEKKAEGTMPFSCVLLDPPRLGVGPLTAKIAALDAHVIVYISCNFETFAKDAAAITKDGKWELRSADLLDMFPQTRYAEVVGIFTRK